MPKENSPAQETTTLERALQKETMTLEKALQKETMTLERALQKETMTLERVLSPTGMCVSQLSCGHLCARRCHRGACGTCKVRVEQVCACGRERREVTCGEGDVASGKGAEAVEGMEGAEGSEGRWRCGNTCG